MIPNDGRQALRILISEIDAYLARLAGEGASRAREGIARWQEEGPLPVPEPPRCGFLQEAIAAIEGEENASLKQAIAAAQPFLRWISYDAYPLSEIGGRFAEGHAFASLIGEAAPIAACDFELGLFLIAPHIFYRDHHHAAPELYAPLTGPHGWRFGIDLPLVFKPAHEPVWNEPFAPHATLTGDHPFLCIFCWTRDVNASAKVIKASDWEMIEAQNFGRY